MKFSCVKTNIFICLWSLMYAINFIIGIWLEECVALQMKIVMKHLHDPVYLTITCRGNSGRRNNTRDKLHKLFIKRVVMQALSDLTRGLLPLWVCGRQILEAELLTWIL